MSSLEFDRFGSFRSVAVDFQAPNHGPGSIAPRSNSEVMLHAELGRRLGDTALRARADGLLAEILVDRFARRGTEPFELFRPEFGQNSVKIQCILLVKK